MSLWRTAKAATAIDWREAWRRLAACSQGAHQGRVLARWLRVVSGCERLYRQGRAREFLAALDRLEGRAKP